MSALARLETRIPPVVWLALALVLVWGIAAVDRHWRFVVNGSAELAAIALALIGLGVILDALGGFTRDRTSIDPHHPEKASSLVTRGMYRFSRNPMYLGMVLFIAGWALWLSSLVALVVGPAAFITVMTLVQIRPEERALRSQFGSEYEGYCDRVRRWI